MSTTRQGSTTTEIAAGTGRLAELYLPHAASSGFWQSIDRRLAEQGEVIFDHHQLELFPQNARRALRPGAP